MDRTLILAHGKAALPARDDPTTLERGIGREFGDLMGIYAVTVADEDEDQGDILAIWAGMIRDTAKLHEP